MVRLARRPYQEAVGTQASSPPGRTNGGGESAEEIQRKIEEIKRQIAQMDVQQGGLETSVQNTESLNDSEFEEIIDEYVEEESEQGESGVGTSLEEIRVPRSPSTAAPASPTSSPWRNRRYVAQSPDGGHHDAYRKQMDDLKQKFSFERPGWAAPPEVVQKEEDIDRDSINNPLLKKAQMGGYVRQVKEKDIDLVKGTFVKDTQQKLEPRLAWIVVNVGKRKAGKIVMHLYGRDVHRLVDQFLELKGHQLQRPDSGTLAVVGMDPALHVLATRATQGLDSRSGVFGVIQEGLDVFQAVMAADAHSELSVKQSHIFPVVKGKKEFSQN